MTTKRMKRAMSLATVLLVGGAMGAAMADDPKTQEGGMDKLAERESSQPVNDTWITTKVKTSLLANDDVSGLQLNVETVEGVVTLTGDADSQAEVDRAVAVAKGIEGVVRVDGSGIKVRGNTE